jgi:hypothetical protein
MFTRVNHEKDSRLQDTRKEVKAESWTAELFWILGFSFS